MSWVGQTIGRRRVTGTLGKGGMGEVYVAWDPTLERKVALNRSASISDSTPRRGPAFATWSTVDRPGRALLRLAGGVALRLDTGIGVGLDEDTLVVPHPASRRIFDAVAKRLGIDSRPVFSNVASYGNTGSASIPLALCDVRAAGRLRPDGKVLLVSFGAGFRWAAALLAT